MSFESVQQNKIETTQEKLNENLGVVFCTDKKDGERATLESQIEEAESLDFPSVQFDFRKRTNEELLAIQERLKTYREINPDVHFSIHGETARISEENAGIENNDRIIQELRLTYDLGAESYTTHPPRVGMEVWRNLPEDVRGRILDNYSSVFVEAMADIAPETSFSVALENMPTKGEDGVLGQTIEEMRALTVRLENALIENGTNVEIARRRIGITLDVNHALHGVSVEHWEEELTHWFKEFEGRIKVIHVYTPSQLGSELKRKYQITLDLAALYSPDARIFLESKQGSATTAGIYGSIRQG